MSGTTDGSPVSDAVGGDSQTDPGKTWTRRRALRFGLGGLAVVAAAGAVGFELVDRGVVPGKSYLDQLDGACSIGRPSLTFSPVGPSISGAFRSQARNRLVGYTVGYPPGHGDNVALPLVVMLHGQGGNHRTALFGMSPAQAVALNVDGSALEPMAIVTVDGGDGYWNPHPGDDPLAMVIDELIPMCQQHGLGMAPKRIGLMGISMGGYGALLMAEKYPQRFAAVSAISPAIWTSYGQARHADARAYASASAFAAGDAVTHAAALAGLPVRIASGHDDPFHPGVVALAHALPAGAIVDFSSGCHDAAFFTAHEPPSLAFLAQHLG